MEHVVKHKKLQRIIITVLSNIGKRNDKEICIEIIDHDKVTET